jgi:pimeloyl-ACP methyl ester carboxylesterase
MQEIIEITFENLTFDCRVAGNKSDALVIFLHGFPETSFMWKDLILDISKLGFYCIAPNLRGYSNKACPSGKKKLHFRQAGQGCYRNCKVNRSR